MLNKHVSSGWSGQAGFHTLCAGDGSQIAFVVRAGIAPCSRGRELVKIALLCLCLIFAVTTPARPQGSVGNFTTIDVLGAGTGVFQGTIPLTMNAAGDIAGVYVLEGNVFRGFVFPAGGTITPFNPLPTCAGTGKNQGIIPLSINTAGDIAGYCSDGSTRSGLYHGFIRAANGGITTFEVPGAYAGFDLGTGIASINAVRDVTGFYRDASSVLHGFVRAADGTITAPIDAPGAGTGKKQGTFPLSINTAGDGDVVAGTYTDASGGRHGFVRPANGPVTPFDAAPGAGTGPGNMQGTFALSINTAGEIAGTYTDASGGRHGFVRATDGTITSFDGPGAAATGTAIIDGTFGFSINTNGDIAGTYLDAGSVIHGFVRAADGTMTPPIDAPGAGTGALQGTASFSINDLGKITGAYADPNGMLHGYVAQFTATPQAQVSNLQNTVGDFVSAGTLSPGQGQFLLAPLNAALAALGPATDSAALTASDPGQRAAALPRLHGPAGATAERIATNRGHDRAAIRDLEEFIGRVRLLMLLRRLSHADGGTLIDAAESIIRTLRSQP